MWQDIGGTFSDGAPGLAQSWRMYVSREGKGRFHVMAKGDEVGIEMLENAEQLVGFMADYGEEWLEDLIQSLKGTRGFEKVVRMAEFRLGLIEEDLDNSIET